MDPVAALNRIAFLLERSGAPTYRVRAFRTAAAVVSALPAEELVRRLREDTLQECKGIGAVTATVVSEAAGGVLPAYLVRLEDEVAPLVAGGDELRAALRGDCHSHSDWSDGGSPIEEMASTARDLGHDYLVLTDHSPRLTVAHGLTADRLRRQLDVVAEVSAGLAPFRLLTGIEVDILEDGRLDQEDDLLQRLDVVVASAHSLLRMDGSAMTRRLVAAVANPHTDILGHCTGRLIGGKKRPQSQFDAEIVFEACRTFGVAVEINCRPERLDPPDDLLALAFEMGCVFAIDTDAHAPGQLDWQAYGCTRAAAAGIGPDRIVNAGGAAELLAWAGA